MTSPLAAGGRARGARRRASRVALAGAVLAALVRFVAVAQVPPATRRPSTLTERLWNLPASPVGPTHAAVLLPPQREPGARWPLLIALHGWGESNRGTEAGAWGWSRDYELGATDAELRHTPLRRSAFLGFVATSRFDRLRRDLARRAYRGVVVVTPYTPDTLDGDAGTVDLAAAYGDWIVNTLVRRARAELPVLRDRASTGVDGVSLGGLTALEVGLRHPETFGVVGALQPAVHRRVERVLGRRPASPPPQRIRLVATRSDGLTRHVVALHDAMLARGVAHELRIVEGPHDYVFNRGAGGLEMLLFHDRALRGMPAE